ncbi:MAG: 2-amino-4-hydroxy-6-hydroxymethyldihydropteridine diphosphokinase [Patescibacteria group bacterium]
MLAYLSLGSNLGDRFAAVNLAVNELQKVAGETKKVSSLYETEPVGDRNQPWFLNCCLSIETTHTPEQLFELCQAIEQQMGRAPEHQKNAPRPIDIDILYYGNQILNTPQLVIPHPEMQNRLFVLQPLWEIAPAFTHPVLKKSNAQLLKECKDVSIVRLYY